MPDLTAVILAGGLGTRLQPAVAGRPKVLAPVLGRPFITFLLDQIAAAGIRSAVLCTGYLGDQVRAELGGSYAQVRLAYAQEEEPLGTGGALRNALPLIEGETLLAMNGDTYAEADWDDFYARHRAWGSRVTLLLAALAPGAEAPGYAYEAPPGLTQPASAGFVGIARCFSAGSERSERFGSVQVTSQGQVTAFQEKVSGSDASFISAGVYLIERSLLAEVPAGEQRSLERELLPGWIGRGLHGFAGATRFLDIGTVESYACAERFIAASRGVSL